MPDTIEPGSFINFAKRQKMANLIQEIYNFQQTPYNLKPVIEIQDYLKQLDIYDMNEMKILSEKYQEISGDKNITEDIFVNVLETKDPRSNSGSKNQLTSEMRSPSGLGTFGKSLSSPVSPRASIANLISHEGSYSPRTSVSTGSKSMSSSNSSQVSDVQNVQQSQETSSSKPSQSDNSSVISPEKTELKNSGNEPVNSSHSESPVQAEQTSLIIPSTTEPVKTETPSKVDALAQVQTETPTPVKTETPTPVKTETPTPSKVEALAPVQTETPISSNSVLNSPSQTPTVSQTEMVLDQPISAPDTVDLKLMKVFPGSRIMNWKEIDKEGIVYGWPGEEINLKIVVRNADSYLVPLFSPLGNIKIDKPDLSLCVRVGQFYESMGNQKPTKLVAFAQQITVTARPIANQIGIQCVISPP